MLLSAAQKEDLLRRYYGRAGVQGLSYGTVKDFCDSSDHMPFLSHLQGDLKDLQRPAALKAILQILPVGSSLLEVGAGEPFVAQLLSELGYDVTVVDPYDGSGNGPIEFERYQRQYPGIRIVRDLFSPALDNMEPSSIDCIYSISVLEHVHQPALSAVFHGIKRFLKQGGYSLHVIDHVLAGEGADFHLQQLAEILALQAELAAESPAQGTVDLVGMLAMLVEDPDVYFLSAEGHNQWRGGMPYESFPYRKVVSVHSCKRMSQPSV